MARRHTAPLVAALVALGAGTAEGQTLRTVASSRQVRGEEDLTLRVRFALGEFHLRRDEDAALYRANLIYDEERFEPVHAYTASTRTLDIGIDGRDGIRLGNLREPGQRIDLSVSPQVPATLQLEFGAGRSDIDLGGLKLVRADVKTGASETRLEFSRPTTGPCEALIVHVGAAEFVAAGLGNANCSAFEVKGAAGSITLDFTGEWQRRGVSRADVALGLGGLNLRFPTHLGVSIEISRFLASFDRSGFVKRGDRYVSENYDAAGAKLDMRLEAFVGDIDVEWVPH